MSGFRFRVSVFRKANTPRAPPTKIPSSEGWLARRRRGWVSHPPHFRIHACPYIADLRPQRPLRFNIKRILVCTILPIRSTRLRRASPRFRIHACPYIADLSPQRPLRFNIKRILACPSRHSCSELAPTPDSL